MTSRKSQIIILCTLILLTIYFSSCRYFKHEEKSALSIIDTRIGTGEQDISIGTIVFNVGEKVILTFDIKNITSMKMGKINEPGIAYYWLREDLILRDKNGNVALIKPAILNVNEPTYSKPLKFKNIFNLPKFGMKPGRYSVSLVVTDLISFKTAKTSMPIIIK